MKVYDYLLSFPAQNKAGHFVLIDPDERIVEELPAVTQAICEAGVDAILVGGSLLLRPDYPAKVKAIKSAATIPVILFPGSLSQIAGGFDAVLFLSVISGRNPDYLFGDHVMGAPQILALGLEPISTGYMLIESGRTTTAEFMSNTRPIPAHKPDIAVAHALAAQMMGFKLLYLEAGSGADHPVPEKMIAAIRRFVQIPIIVGGGIRDIETAVKKIRAGADFIVTGNLFQENGDPALMKAFAEAIHQAKSA
jgi:phosphoglycerol geranylgeranyltransferase